MSFPVERVISSLRRLESITTRLRRLDHSRARIDEALATIDALLRDLKQAVVSHDDLMRTVASEEELVFRAIRHVMLTELAALDDALHLQTERAKAPGHPASVVRAWGPHFRTAISFERVELARITSAWTLYRPDHSSKVTNLTGYHVALCTTVDDLHALAHSPELGEVLRQGVTSAERLEIGGCCERILAVARVRVDLDAARVFWVGCGRPSPLGSTSTGGAP